MLQGETFNIIDNGKLHTIGEIYCMGCDSGFPETCDYDDTKLVHSEILGGSQFFCEHCDEGAE